uniref:Aquaporin-3 n=1 Tax=Calidris pygmaea TaxID=425635 RepID=A0A8C3PKX1_9CHAR
PMGSPSFLERAQALLRVRNQLARECLAELLAVFVLIVSGACRRAGAGRGAVGALGVLGAPLARGYSRSPRTLCSQPRSLAGAHLNPAFSLAMCLLEQFPWWKFPIFMAVQTFGAFISSAAVYAVHYDAIWHYSNGTLTTSGPRETASIFATYPADYVSITNGFVDQVIGTAVLIVGLLAIMDTRNKAVPKGLEPVVVALLVLSIEVSMGSNCGCPMNPARDFGPRLFTYVAGWGAEVFSRGNGWWWVPVVAPLLGSVVGFAVYQLFVALHHPPEDGAPRAEQNSLVFVGTALTEMSPGEKDAAGILPQKK